MAQQWQTVAIPFAQGIKPTSAGRALEQTKLLTAQNCFFHLDEGPQKRYGHVSRDVAKAGQAPGLNGLELPLAPALRTPFSFSDPGLSASYLHGWGLYTPNTDTSNSLMTAVSSQVLVGNLFGVLTRDQQIAAWDGHRLLVRPDSDFQSFGAVAGQAVFPAVRGEGIAKSLAGQIKSDAADNGVLKTVVWISGTTAYRSVYSSVSGACHVSESSLGLATVTDVRVITLGSWTHILARNTGDTTLWMFSCQNDTPATLTTRNMGDITEPVFDVKKYSEEYAVIARVNSGDVEVTIIRADGNNHVLYTPDVGGGTVLAVTAATHPSSKLGLLWLLTDFTPQFSEYDLMTGIESNGSFPLNVSSALSAQGRITLCETLVPASVVGEDLNWIAYIQVSATELKSYRVCSTAAAPINQTTRYNTVLASHAFRVGNRAYVWCTGTPSIYVLQPTWYLCDQQLQPVGKILYGLAYQKDPTTNFGMPGVNWTTDTVTHPAKDRVVFMGALGYKQRAETRTSTPDPNGVFTEPSVFFYTLDFLPRITSAQAGRATYISGAQLWEFDGVNLNEAGFIQAPESAQIATGSSGNLDKAKEYSWRIDLCYKNAQNEEIRSWSSVVTRAAASTGTVKMTLTINHVPMTRRDNSYFLVYRTEGNGTEYYLVSSRDPADVATDNGFLFNSRSAATYTFTDNLADTVLIQREYHPANATGFLQPLPAPACEVVAAGRARVWLAGGELSPGEIAPSRYFQPGETPSFSPALNIQIDRNSEPITAIGFVGQQAVLFRRTSAYTLDSDGPDNTAQGTWGVPQLALADVGAVEQSTLALAGEGLYFQSTAGFRVITQGGGLRPPGAGLIGGLGTDVDTLAVEGDYAAAVVFPKFSQIRWYSRDPEKPTLVVDYTKNVWTTWTGLECQGAVYSPSAETVVIARATGQLWTEQEGRYYDSDRTYEMTIKTAWFRAGNLGDFERIKRFALFGAADSGLSLKYRVYYDERPFWSQEGSLDFVGTNPTTKFNPSTWGAVSWGFGPWGDESAESVSGVGSGLYFRDGVFKFRRRLKRQKCSVFSLEFTDQGSAVNFQPVVIALELGAKPGLDRI